MAALPSGVLTEVRLAGLCVSLCVHVCIPEAPTGSSKPLCSNFLTSVWQRVDTSTAFRVDKHRIAH